MMPGEWDWMKRLGGFFGTPQTGNGNNIWNLGAPDPAQEKRDAMMAMASSLLSNSGYSPQRKTFPQLVGEALQARQQSVTQSREMRMREADNQLRQQIGQQQVEALKRQQAMEQGRADDWKRTAPRPAEVGQPQDGIGPVPGANYQAPTLAQRSTTAMQSALDRGDFEGAVQNAQLMTSLAKEPNMTDDLREYRAAQAQGYPGSFFDYQRALRKASASPAASISVNTDRSLYGTLAEQQAKQYSELYNSAQAAPETIQRAERIRQVLSKGAFTGTGAEFKLQAGKAFRAAGWDLAGSDIENTEAVIAEMARSTLDSIKSSGLAGSQGLTEGERKFLERAVSGQISLEAGTIVRLADLNERVARSTLKRWNDTSGRLDAAQLRQLGMTQIPQPAPTSGGALAGRLTQNPDGSYNYSPGR